MGANKALLDVDGSPLLIRHIETFRALGLRVHVVLGCDAERIARALPTGVVVHHNHRWADTGLAESAAIALVGTGAAILTPVDVPPATLGDVRRLLDAAGPAVLTYRGADGHPVRLDPPHERGRLDRRLVGATRIPVDDPARILNLNTPDQWESWLKARS
ncbi:MAG: hypothetical protein EXR71_05970 [Myxococcales bacterium]|nr:hypothetical protein [Myxococcales bacterium]